MNNAIRKRMISREKLSCLSMQPMPYLQRVNGFKGGSTIREKIKEKSRKQDQKES
jgi:hypothetical protein